MAKKTNMVHVAIDEKTKANISREARAKKVSVGWVIREAIEKYLAGLQKEQGA
jgi:Ribbon-helix-helix protein, copG family